MLYLFPSYQTAILRGEALCLIGAAPPIAWLLIAVHVTRITCRRARHENVVYVFSCLLVFFPALV